MRLAMNSKKSEEILTNRPVPSREAAKQADSDLFSASTPDGAALALARAVSAGQEAAAGKAAPAPVAAAAGGGPPPVRPATKERGTVRSEPVRAPRRDLPMWGAAAAALVGAAALGTGLLLGEQAGEAGGASLRPIAAAIEELRTGQAEAARQGAELATLAGAVESLKVAVDRSRADAAVKQAQLLDRIDRGPADAAGRAAKLAGQLDRIEDAAREAAKEPAARLAALGERLDRIERQLAALQNRPAAAAPAPAAPAAAEAPTQTGTVAKDAAVEGWTLREVYDGFALIEGRNRRLVEVGAGDTVPGVGRVAAIERRNKRWVVVTSRGVIEMAR
jgi:hypothetical protein